MKNYLTIKDLPKNQRPRERLLKYGAKALSDVELLAVIIRTGTRSESALMLAQRLLKGEGSKTGLSFVADASIEELSQIKGIGPAKSIQIKAAIELGRRIHFRIDKEDVTINCPNDICDLLMNDMSTLKKEYFKVLLLNIKNKVIALEEISVGSLNASIVHPREVFKPAIKRSSASIILVHNHPSGDPTPSREDIEVTMRLVEAGNIIGIEVLDHIIFGNNRYISFREEHLM